jgi:hypothetical protein
MMNIEIPQSFLLIAFVLYPALLAMGDNVWGTTDKYQQKVSQKRLFFFITHDRDQAMFSCLVEGRGNKPITKPAGNIWGIQNQPS